MFLHKLMHVEVIDAPLLSPPFARSGAFVADDMAAREAAGEEK